MSIETVTRCDLKSCRCEMIAGSDLTWWQVWVEGDCLSVAPFHTDLLNQLAGHAVDIKDCCSTDHAQIFIDRYFVNGSLDEAEVQAVPEPPTKPEKISTDDIPF